MEEEIINLSEVLQVIKKRWLIVLFITLFCGGLSLVISMYVVKPTYETSTKLFIGKEQNSVDEYDTNEIFMYQKLLKTYSELVKTKDLIIKAIDKTSYNLTTEEVLNNLEVITLQDTQILLINYKGNNPSEAKEVLESITNEFIIRSKGLVPNGNIRIIESVYLPESPVNSNVKINIAIGSLLGLIISGGLVFLLEYLNNTYKSKEQLENSLEIPVLGVIPKWK